MKPTSIRALIVVGAALVLGIGGTIAYAQIPSPNGVFTACVVKSTGAIRMIDTARTTHCRSTETKVYWNQRGIPGTPGDDGKDGTNGKDAFEFARYTATAKSTQNSVNTGNDIRTYRVQSLCDEGDALLYGHVQFFHNPTDGNYEEDSGAIFPNGREGWEASTLVYQGVQVEGGIFNDAQAYCADSAAPFDHTP